MSAAVGDLASAARAVDARRARSRQRALGPSSVGGCRRRAAYAVAGTARTDAGGSRLAAILGTWIHKGALAALKAEFGAAIEVPLGLPDSPIKGSGDAVYLDALTVEDVKTTGRFAFDWRVERGPSEQQWFQVMIYAWLLRTGQVPAAGRRKLRAAGWEAAIDAPAHEWQVPITQVVLRFVNRDTGEEWPQVRDYDPEVLTKALEWLATVIETTEASGAEALPRDEDGPGLSAVCDSCVFLTACWGPQPEDERVARQSILIRDDADAAEALAEYDEGRRLEGQGKKLKAFAREKLTGTEAAQYGPLVLGWSGGDKIGEQVDMDAVAALYASAGLALPMKPKPSPRVISVKKAKAAKVPTVADADRG